MALRVIQATAAEDLAAIRELFLEYAAFLGVSLCFQDFDGEVERLPGNYAPPAGSLLLARDGDVPAGCGAFRPLAQGVCEMKRLYVRPSFRGTGLGRGLAAQLIAEAKTAGYASMRLDTIPAKLPEATALYRTLGFVEIPAYYDNPIPGVAYFELKLR
ncbi:MAG TPA: GNAT family N-acetyltransferase [Chloroflexota bacterium]